MNSAFKLTIISLFLLYTSFQLHFISSMSDSDAFIYIDKSSLTLWVISEKSGDTVFNTSIGLGKEYGDKENDGDNRTPEGTFFIEKIENSSNWVHDFRDGFGPRKGAYGEWFIRLNVPGFNGIGIHGTCFPESIGTRCSEGCVRLHNDKIIELKELCFIGMKVVISKDSL